MAADTASFRGDFITDTKAVKIIRTRDGHLVGCAGVQQYGDRFRDWARAGFPDNMAPPGVEKEEDFAALVVTPGGRVIEYAHDMTSADVSGELVHSEGAGHEFVFALATLGWSAEEIVAHAIKYCAWAGGEVYALRLDDYTPAEPDDEPDAEETPGALIGEFPPLEAALGFTPEPQADAFLERRGLK